MSRKTGQRESTGQRRGQSRERLLAAAEDQLREEDIELFSIDRVVERAEESVGTFYRIFSGKQSLLVALQDRLHDRMQPPILASLKAEENALESLEDAVDHSFGVMIDHVLDEMELCRAFMLFSALDPVLREGFRAHHIERRDAITTVLQKHRSEINHPDPDEAIHHAYHLYLSTMHGRLVFLRPGMGPVFGVSNDAFFAHLKLSILSFLLGTDGSRLLESEAPRTSE